MNGVLVRTTGAIVLAGSNEIEVQELQVTETRFVEKEAKAIVKRSRAKRHVNTMTRNESANLNGSHLVAFLDESIKTKNITSWYGKAESGTKRSDIRSGWVLETSTGKAIHIYKMRGDKNLHIAAVHGVDVLTELKLEFGADKVSAA